MELTSLIKVRFKKDADRFPHFIVPTGTTGTIVYLDKYCIVVKVDDLISLQIEGISEWENEVTYSPDFIDAFKEEIEIINENN